MTRRSIFLFDRPENKTASLKLYNLMTGIRDYILIAVRLVHSYTALLTNESALGMSSLILASEFIQMRSDSPYLSGVTKHEPCVDSHCGILMTHLNTT